MKVKILIQVEKALEKEIKEIRLDVQDILEKLELGLSLSFPHVRPLTNIHSNLFEIRVKDKRGQFRVIYFVRKGDVIYLLHAFRKKDKKISQKEKKIILSRLKGVK